MADNLAKKASNLLSVLPEGTQVDLPFTAAEVADPMWCAVVCDMTEQKLHELQWYYQHSARLQAICTSSLDNAELWLQVEEARNIVQSCKKFLQSHNSGLAAELLDDASILLRKHIQELLDISRWVDQGYSRACQAFSLICTKLMKQQLCMQKVSSGVRRRYRLQIAARGGGVRRSKRSLPFSTTRFSKGGDQEGSTTAAQLAATETLESIKAKSERAFAAVCVKEVSEKQCQTILHESELTEEGTTSWSKKDGRAERDESQSESEDDAMTDSDDESLPGSEGGSSVAPADEKVEASISSTDSTMSTPEEGSDSVPGHNSTLASATRTQEKKNDSADPEGSDWTIPAEVGGMEGSGQAAPADSALPLSPPQDVHSSAAQLDDAGSQHIQEYESGSDESSYDAEAESASDSTEGIEAEGTSEDGSIGAVSLEDDDQEDCTTAAQLAAAETLVQRLTQQQQRADIQLAQQQAQLLQKDQLTVDLNLRIADLEGQAAYVHWLKRKTVMPEGDHSALFSMTSETWGCDDLEEKVRASILETSGTERVGVWEWKLSSFSQVVKVLVTTEQTRECDVVGKGAGGQVKAACMLMDDGTEEVVVIKPLPYQTPEEILVANAELAALKDAQNCETIVQCWGVFDHRDPFDGTAYVQMIMEYVNGLDVEDAMRALLESQYEPDFDDRWWKAGKILLKCLLEGAKWLAEEGRGHCDIKSANIRVQLTSDGQCIESAKLVDLGCSLKHKGLRRDSPANLGCTNEFSSPEFVSRDGGKYIDACAQDMWGIGYVAYIFFARKAPWRFAPTSSKGPKHARLDHQHTAWAGTFESANAIVDADSPLLMDLRDEMEDFERYVAMAQLLRKLLHPDLSSRATADQALTELESMS